MKMKKKTYMNWSSGKDAALALYYMQQKGGPVPDRLLTSVNGYHNRVSMHGLRRELLQAQMLATGLEMSTVELPEEVGLEVYDRIMGAAVAELRSKGYDSCAFGDIFLEDLRKYREERLGMAGIHCYFPLWKMDTAQLLQEFIGLGFKAVVICINATLLDESFLGREIDESFIKDLPPQVDPCGENGEFHTFCYDGPVFSAPVHFVRGQRTYREYPLSVQDGDNSDGIGFWFLDLLP